MKLTRHVGEHTNNKSRIILVLPVIENTSDCLVIFQDTLPHDLKEAIFHSLNSQEGQAETNFSNVLNRIIYANNSKSLLQTVHELGFIKKISIDEVTMKPAQALSVPLRDVLVQSGLMASTETVTTGFNPHAYNAASNVLGESVQIARNLLVQAEMCEADARAKRAEAYQLAPSLHPDYIAKTAPIAPSETSESTTEAE